MAAAIEAVCTHLAFGKADSLNQCFKCVELQGAQPEALGNGVDHALVFGGVGGGIFIQILVMISFKLLDDAAGDELEVAPWRT